MDVTTKQAANFKRLFDLINYQIERYPNKKALNYFHQQRWHSISIEDIKQKVDSLSCWLLNSGYQKDEKVILVPFMGHPDWMIIDFACQQLGVITVPVHPNLPDKEVQMILAETEARLCITTSSSLQQYQNVGGQFEKPPMVYQIEQGSNDYFLPLQVMTINSELLDQVNKIKGTIDEDQVATILYTSGSSGEPKGVMLSHYNLLCSLKSILTFFPLQPEHRVISFLPFSHILERAAAYAYIAFGVSVYFSESRESFSRDFKMVRPYFCTCVPRVLEKMYDFLQHQILTKNAVKRKTIQWAIEVGKKYKERERISILYGLRLALARLLVLRYWRKMLGGKIKYMVVGAASLRPEIGRLLSAGGIQVVEGYGLTETSPIVSINRFEPGLNKFGTVGLVVPSVEIKLEKEEDEEEGEILVKGPNVMLGYYKKPELTRQVLSNDGWFRTGDIGKIVEQRFLQITDRKKDIFKTSSGKYIAPQQLQNHFRRSSFIERCLAMGFQRPFVTLLIQPNFSILEAWCIKHNVHWTSAEFMIHNIKVIEKYDSEIEILNEELQNYQQVKGFVLSKQEWSLEDGEITATMKPVRQVLEENYKTEIEKLYAGIN